MQTEDILLYAILIGISISLLSFMEMTKSYGQESTSITTSCVNGECIRCVNDECNTTDINGEPDTSPNNNTPTATSNTGKDKPILWAE